MRLIAMIGLAGCLVAGDRPKNWEPAVIKDLQESIVKTGTIVSGQDREYRYGQNGQFSQKTSSAIKNDQHAILQYVTVETKTMNFVALRKIVARWQKRLDVTVGATRQVAIDGKKLYLRDDAGKEVKLDIVRKQLLQ